MTDKVEFCNLIREHEKPMYHLAFSIVGNDTDAGEVLSESIFRAYKNLNSLKNRDAFKSWILRIVHNTAVELIRKNTRIVPVEETPEIALEGCENHVITKMVLREAINNLKQPYRTAIILYYYDGISIPEIAKITDYSVAAVKQHLSRGRKILREALKEDFKA